MEACEPPCDRVTEYTLETTTNPYPALRFIPAVRASFAMQGLQYTEAEVASLSKVAIFYRSSDKTVVETRVQYSVLTLVANFGGSLGLWLGASIVTVVQVLFYAVKSVYAVCASS